MGANRPVMLLEPAVGAAVGVQNDAQRAARRARRSRPIRRSVLQGRDRTSRPNHGTAVVPDAPERNLGVPSTRGRGRLVTRVMLDVSATRTDPARSRTPLHIGLRAPGRG